MCTNSLQLALNERARRPVGHRAADVEEEIRDQLAAARRVGDLRMKLHSEDRLILVAHRGDRNGCAARRHDVPWRRPVHVIAMTHPRGHALLWLKTGEQPGGVRHLHLRSAILTL